VGHATGILTQVEEYMPTEHVTKLHIPRHNANQGLVSFTFHEKFFKIDVIGNACKIGPIGKVEILEDDSSYTVFTNAKNMITNHKTRSIVKSALRLKHLPKIVHGYCKGKELLEIDAFINKTQLTSEEYEKNQISHGIVTRNKRSVHNCQNQCELGADGVLKMALEHIQDEEVKKQIQFQTSLGFACTQSGSSCEGRTCQYTMTVTMLKGGAKGKVFDGYQINLAHDEFVDSFCVPCCTFATATAMKENTYKVLACAEFQKSSNNICTLYSKHGRCGSSY
jgi:hypothetical protein